MNRIILKPGEEDRILRGHPWVYDNEIASEIADPDPSMSGEGVFLPGSLADVESSRKKYLGRAFVNPHSKIRARIFSRSKEGVDKGFFKRRIREAVMRRMGGYDLETESARIVFGEADFLPGLVVDRFVGRPFREGSEPLTSEPPQSWLAVQFLTFGMDFRRDEIVAALKEVLSSCLMDSGVRAGIPSGIIERNEAPVRELERLPQQSGLIEGSFPDKGIIITENGLPFLADLMGGQKTGHFLDQRDNRALAARFAKGRRVLDSCCHTGGFSVHAARSGAVEAIALDVSSRALDTVRVNARLNGVDDRVRTLEGNVFDVLRNFERSKERFGMIILDPPAFAKSRSAIEGAVRGYREINLRAMNLLEKGGILVTCSCSHAMDEARFRSMIGDAAGDAGRRLHQISFTYQSGDHPVLVGFEESLYLKCGIYEVV